MQIFVQSQEVLSLDIIAQRYGVRPSSLLELHGTEALLFDMALAASASENESVNKGTLQGQIRSERRNWDKDAVAELKKNGYYK